MNRWTLPTSLNISGVEWDIRTDYRDILYALSFFQNPEFDASEAWEVCLDVIIKDYEHLPVVCMEEAAKKIVEFVDMDMKDDGRKKPHTMDWEQDAPVIIPAINRVIGKDVRSVEYMHWWTFIGAYMEIGSKCLFASILDIRTKKAKGKKLEKHEQEFYRDNRALIDLERKYSAEELEDKKALDDLLG